jgi:hypothetical protein
MRSGVQSARLVPDAAGGRCHATAPPAPRRQSGGRRGRVQVRQPDAPP